ncbi:cystathionine-beta-synthase domain-containing protein [Cavenderia fasciculata]|uniref:Cystathionine-beta-synthase domain-containing protein n=1 Tax=Cavenderia fasciculata TaxID=261658 RepID=F4Q5L7_CACFS|nr:cystathionine-beta-synthase domain-containing protein [Cavenderia fasciculata]EGG17276.1 cystathionine-beta-synthase domain-containing protein [Cavenderia fasciculata]|eukprot:XP_004355760.1 cystathionine-beta-synthase domain-containing protein [Cavenderia fasciculata]
MSEDNKRKSKGSTATEESVKKAKAVAETNVDFKAPLVDTFQAPNDGNALLLKLIHTRVMSVKTREEIIYSAQRDDNLCLVFKGLATKRFLSVPVFTQGEKHKWLSFIDLSDIVSYVTQNFTEAKMKESELKGFWHLADEEEAFKKLKVNDVMPFPTKENKFHPITSDYSLFSVVEIMARDPHAHHIAVLDNMTDRKLLSILTNSQIINFIYSHINLLGSKKDLLIKDFRGLGSEVLTIQESSLAIDAFKLMHDKQVSGLAIVNAQGSLVDTISTRDLKGMATDGSLFWRLYKPVSDFIEYLKNDRTTLRPRNPVFCLEDETFESILTKLYTNQIHRIFVVDSVSSQKPIKVISIGDLLLQVLPF